MKQLLKFLSRLVPVKGDFFLILGIGLLFFGIYQMHQPVAYIVTGMVLMGIGLIQTIPKPSKVDT